MRIRERLRRTERTSGGEKQMYPNTLFERSLFVPVVHKLIYNRNTRRKKTPAPRSRFIIILPTRVRFCRTVTGRTLRNELRSV